MAYAFSVMIDSKLITFTFILMSWKSRKKNEDVCKTSLLYASREDHDKKFSTNLIHKRSGSPFYVIYMPYLDSDIAYKILYISFVSKILHIARTAKDY